VNGNLIGTRVAVSGRMHLTRRQQWLLFAGATAGLAAPLASKAISAAWKSATGQEPPDETRQRDPDWRRLILWTVGSAVVTSLAKLAAHQAAAAAWKEVRGEAPPRKRRRRGRRAFA
jgi:hypothetical protein